MNVDADIPLASSKGLHDSLVGLEETIRPLYCLVQPNAISMEGEAICK